MYIHVRQDLCNTNESIHESLRVLSSFVIRAVSHRSWFTWIYTTRDTNHFVDLCDNTRMQKLGEHFDLPLKPVDSSKDVNQLMFMCLKAWTFMWAKTYVTIHESIHDFVYCPHSWFEFCRIRSWFTWMYMSRDTNYFVYPCDNTRITNEESRMRKLGEHLNLLHLLAVSEEVFYCAVSERVRDSLLRYPWYTWNQWSEPSLWRGTALTT